MDYDSLSNVFNTTIKLNDDEKDKMVQKIYNETDFIESVMGASGALLTVIAENKLLKSMVDFAKDEDDLNGCITVLNWIVDNKVDIDRAIDNVYNSMKKSE